MSGVSSQQREEVFAALVANGLDFIVSSAAELSTRQKFSIAHFATGLELLLKARLFAEHWTLIAENPHGSPWSAVKDGRIKTKQASDLCAALTSVTGDALLHEKDIFKGIFEHRNRVLHWLPHDDVAAVTAEQCRAWHALYRLLTGPWAGTFRDFKQQIEEVEKALRVHREYLQARFDAAQSKLRGLAAKGVLAECPACQFKAGVLSDPVERVTAVQCEVCSSTGRLALFTCGHRHSLFELPVECSCGQEHTKQELAELISPRRVRSPKEMLLERDPPHCGECLEYDSNVVTQGEGYVCLDCGAQFDAGDYSTCEYCGDGWVGYDTEHTFVMGCEFCDGREDRD